ncbi:MAG: hypothetical protein ACI376_02405 [Candidatus Bruticola sp.]
MKIKLRRFFRSYLFFNIVFGTILLVLLSFGTYYGCSIIAVQREEYRSKLAQLEECERNIVQSSAELTVLEKKKDRLEHADGVIDVAREKLSMVNKGEFVCVVKGLPEAESSVSKPPVTGTYHPGRRPSGFFFSLFGPIIF